MLGPIRRSSLIQVGGWGLRLHWRAGFGVFDLPAPALQLQRLANFSLRTLATERIASVERDKSNDEQKGESEVWFYYNHLFPATAAISKFAPFIFPDPNVFYLKEDIARHQPLAQVVEIKSRAAEGGAFVLLRGDAAQMRSVAEQGFTRRYMLMRHHARGFPVQGKPWITDLPRTLSRQVVLDPKLTDEDSYELLRPFGRITSLDNGTVTFHRVQDAVAATYCLQRSTFTEYTTGQSKTVGVHLVKRTSPLEGFKSWSGAHPRVVIPLVFAALFAVAYAVFEPIRDLSVTMKIKGTLRGVDQYVDKYVGWAKQGTQYVIGLGSTRGAGGDDDEYDADDLGAFEKDVDDMKHEKCMNSHGWNKTAASAALLRGYVEEGAPTFMVVNGPKGSGKVDIIETALSETEAPILELNCSKLRASGDEELLGHLAKELGYWPAFLWTNRLLRAAELGIQGLTGQSAGITETTEQQAQRILATAARAVRRVALRNRPKGHSNEGQYLESHPDQLPVIILSEMNGCPDMCVSLLVDWAGGLVKQQTARVIVVTEESSFDKRLSAALPNRVFRVVQAEDVGPEAAKEYVMRKFVRQVNNAMAASATASASSTAADSSTSGVDPSVVEAVNAFAKTSPEFLEPLGGRFTDLQSFGRRLLNGEPPEHALKSLVHSAALEASQQFLTEGHEWSVEQAWTLIVLLANSHGDAYISVPGTVAQEPAFKGQQYDAALEALESSGLVTLRSVGGRITGVKASRPLFRAAFSELRGDSLVSAIMTGRQHKMCIEQQKARIRAAEDELAKLAQGMYPIAHPDIVARHDEVADQLSAASNAVNRYQRQLSQLDDMLKEFGWYCPQVDTADPITKRRSASWGREEISSRFE